jgi:hypothetical protein
MLTVCTHFDTTIITTLHPHTNNVEISEKAFNDFYLFDVVKRHCQQYFSCIVAVSFIANH